MIYHISRRCAVRIVTFALALILTLGALNIVQANRAGRYRTVISNGNQRAFMELSEMMNSISDSLDKGIYASSAGQLSLLSATLWRESEAAKNALAALPVSGEPLEKLYHCLSQVGDYAMTMSQKVSAGGTLSAEELQNLAALADYSHKIGEQMTALERDVTVGGLDIDALERTAASGEPSLSDGFNEMEESFEGYPKLIYDGPFSDNMLEREPLMTKNKPEISGEKALETACRMTARDKSELAEGQGEESSMPCRIFYGGDDNCQFTAAVSRFGGYPVYYLCSREIGEEAVDRFSAVRRAREYLDRLGYNSLTDSYYEIDSGVCTVNFAHEQDGVICYPDLIKVRVAMDNGEIIGFDARSYLTNHRERTLETPALDKDAAMETLSPMLKVESSRLAVIPNGGTAECFAYEFLCRGRNGEGVLVYVDTATGNEEEILLLIENENGVLTR